MPAGAPVLLLLYVQGKPCPVCRIKTPVHHYVATIYESILLQSTEALHWPPGPLAHFYYPLSL